MDGTITLKDAQEKEKHLKFVDYNLQIKQLYQTKKNKDKKNEENLTLMSITFSMKDKCLLMPLKAEYFKHT